MNSEPSSNIKVKKKKSSMGAHPLEATLKIAPNKVNFAVGGLPLALSPEKPVTQGLEHEPSPPVLKLHPSPAPY